MAPPLRAFVEPVYLRQVVGGSARSPDAEPPLVNGSGMRFGLVGDERLAPMSMTRIPEATGMRAPSPHAAGPASGFAQKVVNRRALA